MEQTFPESKKKEKSLALISCSYLSTSINLRKKSFFRKSIDYMNS